MADTGNNRVVRFAAAVLNSPAPVTADAVVGQKDLFSGGANAGGTVSATWAGCAGRPGFRRPE